MFKKSLAAVAVLGAFAASSMAADVTLYGKVDMGLQYQNVETTAWNGAETNEDALTLDSGVGQASRFGIKATEDLGNGYKVTFKLENGFKADDGSSLKDNRLFDREASLAVSSEWGTLMAGRFGAFSTAASATDILMSRVESFDGGHTGAELVMFGRQDNAIAYLSPKVAGFQAAAMYSFKGDKGENLGTAEDPIATREGHGDATRYAGFAVTYDIGALQTAVGYEQLIRSNKIEGQKDQKIVTFGGNYDFDMFKLYAAGQYFEGATNVIDYKDAKYATADLDAAGIEGYGLHVGAKFDALAGHFDTGIYFIDAEADRAGAEKDVDGQYFGIAGRYVYDLSKRTNIRTTLAYNQKTWDKVGADDKDDFERNTYIAKVSLTHNF